MNANNSALMPFSKKDKSLLRELALQTAEIASLPVMEERRRLWKQHNSLKKLQPLVLVFPEGSWRELLPEAALQCEGETARRIEMDLKQRIYSYKNFYDDKPVEKSFVVRKVIHSSGWGIEPRHRDSSNPSGAWGFDPVIHTADDLKLIQSPILQYDPESTRDNWDRINELFGDILDVKLKGIDHVSFHLMSQYIHLRGLEQVMYDMMDEPEMLHEAMQRLAEGNRRLVEQYEALNLLSLNNDETYHSSGGVGYTDELPRPDFSPDRIRPCDIWASAESQEMAQISPEMHEEFVMNYEKELLKPFALNGYGCCEDLTRKLDQVLSFPNMRRISISPWADVQKCAEKLGSRCIFSWKPQPAYIADSFDEPFIRKYIRNTLDCTGDCVLEIILKDTHTCGNHPERFTQWTTLVRELIGGH